jgi:hypothetical protein
VKPISALVPAMLVTRLLCLALFAGAAHHAQASEMSASALSPDGRWRAEVNADDELWLATTAATAGEAPRRLLAPRPDDDPKRNLTGFNHPAFSADGRVLYVLATAWATSNALHGVDVATGATRFISDANDFQVVHEGRHAGRLVVQRHTYLPGGGSREVWFLIAPDGRTLRRIGDDAALGALLRASGGTGDASREK